MYILVWHVQNVKRNNKEKKLKDRLKKMKNGY